MNKITIYLHRYIKRILFNHQQQQPHHTPRNSNATISKDSTVPQVALTLMSGEKSSTGAQDIE